MHNSIITLTHYIYIIVFIINILYHIQRNKIHYIRYVYNWLVELKRKKWSKLKTKE